MRGSERDTISRRARLDLAILIGMSALTVLAMILKKSICPGWAGLGEGLSYIEEGSRRMKLAFGFLALCCLLSLAGCVTLSPEEAATLYHKPDAYTVESRALRWMNYHYNGDYHERASHQQRWLCTEGARPVRRLLRASSVDNRRFIIHPDKFLDLPEQSVVQIVYEVVEEDDFDAILVEWHRVPSEYTTTLTRRSRGLLYTYPLWGFPRDVLDVPWTKMRRLGFADETGILDEDPATPLTITAGAVVGAAGAAGIVLLSVSPASVAIPIAVVALIPGALAGGFAGMLFTLVEGDMGRSASDYVQVPLLRSGIDSEDYFPNWKFIAHRPVMEKIGDEEIWFAYRRKKLKDWSPIVPRKGDSEAEP